MLDAGFYSIEALLFASAKCSPARKIRFLPRRSVRWREKFVFGLGEVFAGVKNSFFVSAKCSLACKIHILSRRSVRWHVKFVFGLGEVFAGT